MSKQSNEDRLKQLELEVDGLKVCITQLAKVIMNSQGISDEEKHIAEQIALVPSKSR